MSNEEKKIKKNNEPESGEIVSNIVLKGDLSGLSPQQKAKYYNDFCRSLGLNPLTQPFRLITFQGRETLYAQKDATEQLRKIHGVSITELSEKKIDTVYLVTAKAVDKNGKTDVSTGAVNIKGLAGEALANAIMKAETKAKRRVTLSICGLGMLDESETDTIPDHSTETIETEFITKTQKDEIFKLMDQKAKTVDDLVAFISKAFKKKTADELTAEQAESVIRKLRTAPDVSDAEVVEPSEVELDTENPDSPPEEPVEEMVPVVEVEPTPADESAEDQLEKMRREDQEAKKKEMDKPANSQMVSMGKAMMQSLFAYGYDPDLLPKDIRTVGDYTIVKNLHQNMLEERAAAK